jgi:hypothetical protein
MYFYESSYLDSQVISFLSKPLIFTTSQILLSVCYVLSQWNLWNINVYPVPCWKQQWLTFAIIVKSYQLALPWSLARLYTADSSGLAFWYWNPLISEVNKHTPTAFEADTRMFVYPHNLWLVFNQYFHSHTYFFVFCMNILSGITLSIRQ